MGYWLVCVITNLSQLAEISIYGVMAFYTLSFIICSLFLATNGNPPIPNYRIYVSNIDGTNNELCLLGLRSYPCSSISYALQGAPNHSLTYI